MPERTYGFGTLALHAGHIPDAATGARAVPLYQTTSYVFDSAEHAASLFNLQTFGNFYTRISNPTVAVLEERVAALEGGRAALAVASGMAAQMTALFTILGTGDEIVAASTLYGGTVSQFTVNFGKLGITAVFVDPDDPENFRRAITPRTKAVFVETIGNPRCNVVDIEALAAITRAEGVPLIVDNTLASPYLCNPLKWGADIVVHSATKFIGGHGTSVGGVVVERGGFNWNNGRFPDMVAPSRGYHGMNFTDTFGDFAFTMKARMETLASMGPALSPFNAWTLIQGLETLHVRMDRHVFNAQKVAEHLASHPRVSWVNYAGLATSPYHDLAKKYLPKGPGSVFAFGVKGSAGAGQRFIEAARFMSHLANVGDAKTLIIHPASTTHRVLSDDELRKAGVTPDMIRISVGIEDVEDILWDIDQALEAAA